MEQKRGFSNIVTIVIVLVVVLVGAGVWYISQTAALHQTITASAPRTTSSRDYSDVLLVVNANSTSSEEIGNYFASVRNIPRINIARIHSVTSEEISDSQFSDLRSQIESYMLSNNLTDKINYIITTKGVPLKVKRDGGGAQSASASVDSELALMFSKWSDLIGAAGSVPSPYYLQDNQFSRAKYGIYLVTRLDGYTIDQVKGLIDRAANPVPFSSSTKFVFDEDPTWNDNPDYLNDLNDAMGNAAQELKSRGFNVVLDATTQYITNQQDVIGYASWGSNDRHASAAAMAADPRNTWHDGALAETYVSTDARTFNWPPQYGQSLIADLIAEGVTGAEGFVYEPYASGMADISVLFDRYTNGFNLAESFYAASPYLSWMGVVIGDPKATISATSSVDMAAQTGNGTLTLNNGMFTLSYPTSWTIEKVTNLSFNIEPQQDKSEVIASITVHTPASDDSNVINGKPVQASYSDPKSWYYSIGNPRVDVLEDKQLSIGGHPAYYVEVSGGAQAACPTEKRYVISDGTKYMVYASICGLGNFDYSSASSDFESILDSIKFTN